MRWHKIFKWEFWDWRVFYIPVYAYWFWLGIRARSFTFFTASNPLMEMGGFTNYSKYNVLSKIPEEFRPKTLLIPAGLPHDEILKKIDQLGISFPLIAKPDIGERGFGVELIPNASALFLHLKNYDHIEFIIQEYVDFPIELGIMYYKYPDTGKGYINSVVQKDFLEVYGDGKSTLRQLFSTNPRTLYHYDLLCHIHRYQLEKVLEQGEKMSLIKIGNHSRGTTFLNGNNLINNKLVEFFDTIAEKIDGYYFGRFDLRVNSVEDLYQGKNIKILELNGANSEPAHIYDPGMSLWEAYRVVFAHWKILWRISIQNHRKGIPYATFKNLVRAIKEHFATKRRVKK